MVSHSGLITVMTRAARKAAPRLRRDFNEVEQLQVSRKGPADFVSQADQRAEQTIFEELSKARPDWGFLMEERGEVAGELQRRPVVEVRPHDLHPDGQSVGAHPRRHDRGREVCGAGERDPP